MHACMHACMDGWMDGWMYVRMYVCMYTVIGPSLVHKCDGLALDTFVQRFVAMILRFLSEMFINHHGGFWGDGMDNYLYIYICVCSSYFTNHGCTIKPYHKPIMLGY